MTNVKSAKRTLEILELMERLRRPARVSEIAKLLGYPQSSTSVLINSLTQLGYLNFNPETHEFAPSIRVALVGGYLRFDTLHAFQVLDLLSAVQQHTGLTTILSSRNGVHAQYVYVVPAPGRGIEGLRAGSIRPLTRTAPGVLLLAECSPDEIGRIVRHLNTLPDIGHHENLDAVLKEVREARKQGYAWTVRRLTETLGSVAVKLPVRDSFGKALAVSVSGSADEITASAPDLARQMSQDIAAHCGQAPPR